MTQPSGVAQEVGGPPFFILACGRSGTTLLRSMLTCHRAIAVPRASHFIIELHEEFGEAPLTDVSRRRSAIERLLEHERVIEFGVPRDDLARRLDAPPAPTVADLCRACFEAYAAQQGKARWGDKTTTHGPHTSTLARLFPDALFIHLVRDPRDVALSLVRTEFQRDLLSAAITWRATVAAIERGLSRMTSRRSLRIRYEDLVSDPPRVLTRICDFLGESFDPAMLEYHRQAEALLAPQEKPIHRHLSRPPAKDQLQKWRGELTPEPLRMIETAAGRFLRAFGYERASRGRMTPKVMAGFVRSGGKRWASKTLKHLRRAPIPGRAVIAPRVRRLLDFAHPARLACVFTRPHDDVDPRRHLDEALAWLCRAQDAGSDDGVARSAKIGRRRFDLSYPETTGYIIPTMFDAAKRLGRLEYAARAVRMGRWEIEIQMPSGAVRGGTGRWHPRPAVFNTGQVMLGWNRLFEETGDRVFLDAAIRAANWLVSIQEPDGNWVRGHSAHAAVPAPTYNLRVAWPLAQTGLLCGDDRYVEAARRYARFALTRQKHNGWFDQCCLTDARRPLTHTLVYATRGALEFGLLLNDEAVIAAATRATRAMTDCIHPDGFLPGRLDEHWRPAVRWCCLTGSMQLAIVLWKLYRREADERLRNAAQRLTEYVLRRHDITSADPTIRGGLYGSWPIHGGYGSFEVLNWATKFLVDALLESEADRAGG